MPSRAFSRPYVFPIFPIGPLGEKRVDEQFQIAFSPTDWRELGENVAIEHRQLHGLLAVAPPMHFGDDRQERLHPTLDQSLHHELLVAGASMQRVPILVFRSCCGGRIGALPGYAVGGHSFALWVTLLVTPNHCR